MCARSLRPVGCGVRNGLRSLGTAPRYLKLPLGVNEAYEGSRMNT
jgi:hypothetical protein